MKYIVMSDGRMTRWKEKHNIPKHLMKINGETLLQRIVRQVKSVDRNAEIIITSHNPLYEVEGAVRYEPVNNRIEIDRFTYELINSDCCFLYGDTCYTDTCIRNVMDCNTNELMFYGNDNSIVALVVKNETVMKKCIAEVRQDYFRGLMPECKGWQLYYKYCRTLEEDEARKRFVFVNDGTQGFNTYEEYQQFIKGDFE